MSTPNIPETVTSTARRESLALAVELGADQATIDRLASAGRLARRETIDLPEGRYSHCSRAKGWARCGRGADARWGERADRGWRVGPGRWVVYSSDGFSREDRTDWVVAHVSVGDQTWTIAD